MEEFFYLNTRNKKTFTDYKEEQQKYLKEYSQGCSKKYQNNIYRDVQKNIEIIFARMLKTISKQYLPGCSKEYQNNIY